MVVRKNISLEQIHLKKLDSLILKHNGNLSAAIRDAIDVTEASLKRYGSVEDAIIGIKFDKKELTGIEESINSGINVLLSRPIFLWMLKWVRGIPFENEKFEDVLDPLKINTISELDKRINDISRESGWNCQISIFSMDDINPVSVTLTIASDNELIREFVAQLAVMFLANYKSLDIDVVHKRATSIRIDLKIREKGAQPVGAINYFGYLKDIMTELRSKEEFWKNLMEIYSAVNYNMVSIYKGNYQDLLACDLPVDAGIFESISKKHIADIPHQDFLKLLKKTEESLLVVDKIEIMNDGINIYHNYKKETAIKKIQEHYISLLRANGHEYEAKYSTTLIVLNHVCCKK
ncbi:MAG: hypothetical protein O8C61_07545 [Candidatus Methanoperedens sp.]|nr:hypothetical protein [Candidatus Methanoperedens sp.]